MSAGDLLDSWGAHLAQGRRRSPHTVRAYIATASRLLSAIGAADWADVAAIDAAGLRAQLARRRMEGLSNASAARELSALKAFIGFARSQAGQTAEPPRVRDERAFQYVHAVRAGVGVAHVDHPGRVAHEPHLHARVGVGDEVLPVQRAEIGRAHV